MAPTYNMIYFTNKLRCFQTCSQIIYLNLKKLYSSGNQLHQHFLEQRENPNITRRVPRTHDEFKDQKKMRPAQPCNPRYLRVSVIGDPNSGKSTLTNQLTGWRVCPVSSKVNTTRCNSSAVLSVDDVQIEFTDTPGTVSFQFCQKHHLEASLLNDPEKSSNMADLLLVLVDASNKHTRYAISPEIKRILTKHKDKQSILVLNKMDCIQDKSVLLEVARSLCNGVIQGRPYGEKQELILPKDKDFKDKLFRQMSAKSSSEKPRKTLTSGWSHFSRLFMISAQQGEGVSSVLECLLENAPHRPWRYHASVVINDKPEDLAKRTMREKLLNTFPEEIGYKLRIQVDSWEIDESDILKIAITIKCPKKSLVPMVIGPAGKVISELSKSAQQELCNVFHSEVILHVGVKYVKPLDQ